MKPKHINMKFNMDYKGYKKQLPFIFIMIFVFVIVLLLVSKTSFVVGVITLAIIMLGSFSIEFFSRKLLSMYIGSYSILLTSKSACIKKIKRVSNTEQFKISYGRKMSGKSIFWILELYINNKKYCRLKDGSGWDKLALEEIVRALTEIGVERKGNNEYYFD